jgi:hypothetical protein
MNRPLWLELLYLLAFFTPPILLAAISAAVLSGWLGLPGWAAVTAHAALAVLALLLWVLGLVAWTRIRSTRAEK